MTGKDRRKSIRYYFLSAVMSVHHDNNIILIKRVCEGRTCSNKFPVERSTVNFSLLVDVEEYLIFVIDALALGLFFFSQKKRYQALNACK